MKRILTALLIVLSFAPIFAQGRKPEIKENIPLDSIRLSDACILADKSTATYYMTGTGGLLWKSKDLRRWTGPYIVTQIDPESWMGPQPMIWAAELHQYKGFLICLKRIIRVISWYWEVSITLCDKLCLL